MKATLIEENEKLNRTCLKKNTDVRNDTENTLIHYVCYFYEVRNDYSKFKIDHYSYITNIHAYLNLNTMMPLADGRGGL